MLYDKELKSLKKYLTGTGSKNDSSHLVYPFFNKIFSKDKIKRESFASGVDLYIEGRLVVELKTNKEDWIQGFYQALHYLKKGLNFSAICVICHDFIGLWKLEHLPDFVTDNDFELIHSYTRTQAIEDGVLVDISSLAREAGFKWSVTVTSTLYHDYIVPSKGLEELGQSVEGRIWDVLNILRVKAKEIDGTEAMFKVMFLMEKRKSKSIQLKAVVSADDTGLPCITINSKCMLTNALSTTSDPVHQITEEDLQELLALIQTSRIELNILQESYANITKSSESLTVLNEIYKQKIDSYEILLVNLRTRITNYENLTQSLTELSESLKQRLSEVQEQLVILQLLLDKKDYKYYISIIRLVKKLTK